MNPNRIITFLLIFFTIHDSFSQNKKEQIASLNFRLDSLNQVIETKNEIIEEINSYTKNLENKIRLSEIRLVESENRQNKLLIELDSLRYLKQNFVKLQFELTSIKDKYNDLLLAMNEFNDKLADIELISNVPFQIDTLKIEKLARVVQPKPCPNENLYGQTENICTIEFPLKQFFKIGNKTYVITMVNFSYTGCRMCSGKSIILLFQAIENNLKLLDSMTIENCCSWGKGLGYGNEIHKIGKQSFAFEFYGGMGGAGMSTSIDYLIAFVNSKLYLVYAGIGTGIDSNSGKNWGTQFSFTPSENEIYNMNHSYHENQEIIGKPTIINRTNSVFKFSMKEKKYLKIDK